MNTTSITEKLKTHEPALLPQEQWPMSKGPYSVGFSDQHMSIVEAADGYSVCDSNALIHEANARYIAAMSPDVVVPVLWRNVKKLKDLCHLYGYGYDEIQETSPTAGPALRSLAILDNAGLIQWTERKGV